MSSHAAMLGPSAAAGQALRRLFSYKGDFFYRFSVLYSFIQLKRNIGRANKKGVDSDEGNVLKEKKAVVRLETTALGRIKKK